MKNISLKRLMAVLLTAALVSTMVMIHSTAADDDFTVKYKTVLDSLSAVSGPDSLTEKVTETTAEDYDNANTAFKLLSDSEKSDLADDYNDIANKLEACARRAKIFTEGNFLFDFDNDGALAKYLYVSQNSNKEFIFSTVQHGKYVPEIAETFIYENVGDKYVTDQYNSLGVFTDYMTADTTTNTAPRMAFEAGVYLSDDGTNAYIRDPAGGFHSGARIRIVDKDWSGFIASDFVVGDIVDGVYQPRDLTATFSYVANDDGDTYYPQFKLTSDYQTYNNETYARSDVSYEKSYITENVTLKISDYTGLTPKVKHTKILRVSYPEVLAEKCAEADSYASTLDVSNITASMADVINKYYSLSVACGDKDYITAQNKAKLETAKKVIDYLVSNSLESITTAKSVKEFETNITDKAKVTALYNEVQEVINLGLGGMFTDAQLAKINSMNNAVELMTGDTYDATDLVNAAVGIVELSSKQIVNDIEFEVNISRLEKAVEALGAYSTAVSNKTVLEQIRTDYNALVESGEYTDASNITFAKTGKRYTSNDDWGWNATSDYGVVSYVNNPSLGAGINKISYSLPVNTYDTAANIFVYSYDGIAADGYADISGIAFFARHDNPNSGSLYTIHKESTNASTAEIPQDTSYRIPSMYNYGKSDYKTRSQTERVPLDRSAKLSDNNNLVWYVSKDNVGKAEVGQDIKTDLTAFMTENGYSSYAPYGKMNVTMEYQGDTNTVNGFNWYLITISGKFCVASGTYVDGTVYSRLFTNGRITTAGVTHSADVEPSTVLTDLSIEVNKAPNALTNGASVRIADVSNGGGIRFESTVNTALYNSLKATAGVNVELGTIIVPENYRGDKEITFDNFKTNDNGGNAADKNLCLDIKQTKWQDEANGVYTAAMINIKKGNYSREFAARGYMKVTYANGDVQYFYSDFDETANVRSIAEVANAAINSGKYNDNAYALGILKTYAGINL